MPVVVTTLEETNRSILSSVYYKIIEDIADVIKIPKDTLTILFKDQEVSLTDARPNTSILDQANRPSTVTKRKIVVRINENYNEDELTTTSVTKQEFYPIFQDPQIGVVVAPVYIQTDVEIEFSYSTPSKTEAERIRDDVRLRLSQHRDISHHQVDYNIIIPTIVEEFIADVHNLKNRLIPEPLDQYFVNHSSKRVHSITDMSNEKNVRLAVSERQVRIIGLFNFSSMPEKLSVNREESTYEFKFDYKFSFSVPKAMSLRYPTMICNRTLPSKYLSFIQENKENSMREYKLNHNYIGNSLANLSYFEAHRQLENRVDINVPINLPLFDEFNLKEGHKGLGVAASVLVEVDETDKKGLLNLNELDPYYIPDVILDFIRNGERQYITTPYASFIYLGLHQDEKYFDAPLLVVGEDLGVKSAVSLELFRPTRVTLSISFDFSKLNENLHQRLIDNPEVLKVFISEYISAVNTYKNESDKRSTDNTFFYFLIKVIYTYLNLEWVEHLKDLVGIISQDKYFSSTLGGILYNGYPDLTQKLINQGVIEIHQPIYTISVPKPGTLKDPLGKDSLLNKTNVDDYYKNHNHEREYRYLVDRISMRTVMYNHISVFRKKDM